jgi:hypothetical protein
MIMIRCATIGQEMRSCDQVASTKVLTVQYRDVSQLRQSETAASKHGHHTLKLTVSRSKTSPTAHIDIQPAHPFHLHLN